MKSIEDKIKALPPELQQEVEDFVESLMREQRKFDSQLKLDWRGALRELKDQYTSVELQHEILKEWSG